MNGFEGLPASVVEAAQRAYCCRCKEQVVGSASLRGTTMVNYYIPAIGVRRRAVLCGACALLLREFLHPEVLDSPDYVAVRDELRSEWV